MKKLRKLIILGVILSLALSACSIFPTQPAPIAAEELQTLVAGTLTAVAFSDGQTQTAIVPPTATVTLTPTLPTPTTAPTFTPTRVVLTVTMNGNTNCRRGASTYFPVIKTFTTGDVVEVLAINPLGDYYFVSAPEAPAGGCWIWKEFATLSGSPDFLPVFTPVPTPLPTATNTPVPAPVFTAEYVGLTTCGTGWATNFNITNTGNMTLQSIRIRDYLEGVVDPYVHTSNSFTQWSAGVKYAVLAEIVKGKSMIVSTCDPPTNGIPTNPLGKKITAEITICQLDDLKGACTTTSLEFIPH